MLCGLYVFITHLWSFCIFLIKETPARGAVKIKRFQSKSLWSTLVTFLGCFISCFVKKKKKNCFFLSLLSRTFHPVQWFPNCFLCCRPHAFQVTSLTPPKTNFFFALLVSALLFPYRYSVPSEHLILTWGGGCWCHPHPNWLGTTDPNHMIFFFFFENNVQV